MTSHPIHQVAAYRSFFRHWRPASAPVLDVRSVAVLHNATAAEGSALSAGAGSGTGGPVLSEDDQSDHADVLAGLLLRSIGARRCCGCTPTITGNGPRAVQMTRPALEKADAAQARQEILQEVSHHSAGSTGERTSDRGHGPLLHDLRLRFGRRLLPGCRGLLSLLVVH
ncbi:hypothetical protein [Streptomyces sp. B21-101]|uniref:hypothetical protein n=1 Tax=Streptomyces sp. B21-101 TaxID=3039415 RepID=UPI002FEF679E